MLRASGGVVGQSILPPDDFKYCRHVRIRIVKAAQTVADEFPVKAFRYIGDGTHPDILSGCRIGSHYTECAVANTAGFW
ncbi:MAG: hypothetical protein CK429_23780 [Mycobacterium sp.]|nr:hypothetical protein [Mycobacterium gordonae]PJE08280.1 MAG: hypothetical protein CK429_23780 [Mycobacterium sp.]